MGNKRLSQELIAELMEEHKDLFDDLANSILCPSCKGITRDFCNLGQKYNWAEGCKACADLYNPKK